MGRPIGKSKPNKARQLVCRQRCIKINNSAVVDAGFGASTFQASPRRSAAASHRIAYALDITTDAIHQELNKIRKIRNEFAHTTKPLSLDTEPIKTLFYTLARPPGITGNYLQQFVECSAVLDNYLEAFLARVGETEDLRVLGHKALEIVEEVK
jgi:hypothetical protein